MDFAALYEILEETTMPFRNGPAVVQQGGTTEIYAMPHVSEAPPDIDLVDVHFMTVGVDLAKAKARRAEFVDMLKHWPDRESLAAGPSYISVGGMIDDQEAALKMFALGQSLGLWMVVTPKALRLEGQMAELAAGRGYIMITGFREESDDTAHS
jgi:hypothetical protein